MKEENEKVKEPRQMKMREREEGLGDEEESWYGTVEAFPPYRPKNF